MAGTISETRQEILKIDWKIANFMSVQGSDKNPHRSPDFRFSGTTWHLSVLPRGAKNDGDFVGFYLHHDDESSSITAVFKMAIKKTDGSYAVNAPLVWKFQSLKGYGCHKMLSRTCLLQKKDEYLYEGALTFSCILKNAPPIEGLDDLSVDSNKILISSKQSDVTFRVRSKEFRAHSIVLSARSKVFASMFPQETLGMKYGVIFIKDCDPDSFKEFLKYQYTGRVNITADNVLDLFKTSDKYRVDELKWHCVAFLMDSLSVDNFCDVFALADDQDEIYLKQFCEQFFEENSESILLTSKWPCFMRDHCVAADKLLKDIDQDSDY